MNEIIKEICKISKDSRLVSLSPDGEAKSLPFQGLGVGLRGTEAASTQKQRKKQTKTLLDLVLSHAKQNSRMVLPTKWTF